MKRNWKRLSSLHLSVRSLILSFKMHLTNTNKVLRSLIKLIQNWSSKNLHKLLKISLSNLVREFHNSKVESWTRLKTVIVWNSLRKFWMAVKSSSMFQIAFRKGFFLLSHLRVSLLFFNTLYLQTWEKGFFFYTEYNTKWFS